MNEISRARQILRKELKQIRQEIKENKKKLVKVSQTNNTLRQHRQKLIQKAKKLQTALQSLRTDQLTNKSNSLTSESPSSQKKSDHAVVHSLIESNAPLQRSDFEKIVLQGWDKVSGLEPSVMNLRLKDILSPSLITDALQAKMARSKETNEMQVVGQAKTSHQPDASRRLAETVQSVAEQLKVNMGSKTKETTKQIPQQMDLTLKPSDGMSR